MLKLLPNNRQARVGTLAEQRPAWIQYLAERRRNRISPPEEPSPPFDPSSVAGLRLWLRADALGMSDDTPVSGWGDLSGMGNDVEQATAMKMPTFKSNILNGLPVVRFDGIDDTLFRVAAGGFTCTHGHTVIAVLNPTVAVAYGMAIVTNYQCNEMRQNWAGGFAEWLIPSGSISVSSAASHEATWRVWTGTYEVASETMELFINGVSQGTNVDAGPLAVGDIYIGSRTDTYHWLGDIAEVLVYDAALGATDRVNIENSLITKYALA